MFIPSCETGECNRCGYCIGIAPCDPKPEFVDKESMAVPVCQMGKECNSCGYCASMEPDCYNDFPDTESGWVHDYTEEEWLELERKGEK